MKILLVADLHYDLKQFDWLLEEAPHYDLVVVAGDLLDVGSLASADAQIVVIRTYLQRLARRSKVVVCSGNHDLDATIGGEKYAAWFDLLDQFKICRDGQNLFCGDDLISALPWWDGAQTKEALVHQIQQDANLKREGGRWIWVHHAPPADSGLSWGGSRFFGDKNLVELIAEHQPDAVLSGHVHQAPFIADGTWADRIGETWCFNMGKQIGDVPSHIALNFTLGEAVWMSMAGPEMVSLNDTKPPQSLMALPAWI